MGKMEDTLVKKLEEACDIKITYNYDMLQELFAALTNDEIAYLLGGWNYVAEMVEDHYGISIEV